ncbi:photosystem II 22 kda polypeptide [Ostreococcus tauri]|uniref:Photosystem II 22 kDa polypeptide n=1 Tax=Ostreococcus tauri TaxID=70448 RepID=A0A1Y5IMQ5_OSTTA|nr:photosystem II 22 kda polypeptide [Ostreococcus tauri]
MHARAIASSSVAHARPGSTRHARGGNGESVTSTSRPAARVRGKRAVARAVAPADEGERDVTDIEINLGRAAMLGFLGTTLGDVITRGEGPIEQLEDEAAYVINHVNPVDLARDALEVAGIYVESVILVWLLLGCALLLGVSQGMRNPIRTVSGRTTKQPYETNVKEQKPYELFNGRLAMLGSAFAFVGDVRTGGLGPLEQVQNEVGIPVIDEEIFAVIFLGGVALNVVSTGITAFRRAYAKGRE